MLCPNCGSENSNERRFCFNCGRAFVSVRSERNEFLDSLSGYRIDSAVVPVEAVFVPSSDDEDAGTNVGPADSAFEDEEADDFFEQSLSGLKLDEEEDSDEAIGPVEPVADFRYEDSNAVVESVELVVTESFTESASLEEIVPERAVKRSKAPRFVFHALIYSLVAAVFFAAGSLATAFYFDSQFQIPKQAELPVLTAATETNTPPAGMAYVPGGEFMMGSDDGDAYSRPAHAEKVDPFFIDQTEVTNQAYFEFVKATDHEAPFGWVNGKYPDGQDNFPVTGVTWYDAAEFAAWKGKRLPTEVEWEFAARGTDGRTYPWGNHVDQSISNIGKSLNGVREVGQGGRSPFGLYDMAGNAWEWTATTAKSFPNGKEIPWSRLRLKIIRGGNWQSDPRNATTFFRGFYGASGEKEYRGTGFRCVKDVPKDR
jgi:formylglycine-generating enzyme required for sulfatase activity